MPKCKFCKEEIEYFNVRELISGGLSFSLDGFDEEPNERDSTLLFVCPECDKEYDFDEEQARDFLEKKDEVKEMLNEKIGLENG